MDTLPTTLIGRLIDWQLVTQIKSHFTHFTFRSKQIYFQNKSSAWALILNELIQMNSLRVRDPVDLLVDGRWRCWDGRWRCWDPANTGPLKPLVPSPLNTQYHFWHLIVKLGWVDRSCGVTAWVESAMWFLWIVGYMLLRVSVREVGSLPGCWSQSVDPVK